MILRPALTADIPLLRAWDVKPHVVAASGVDGGMDWSYEVPRRVDWREILIGEVLRGEPGPRAIGVVVIIDPAREETHYWGEVATDLRAIDIWIGEEAFLGCGHGTDMMRLALARCFAVPAVSAVLVDPLESNERAHRFYERLGFGRVGPRRFGSDDCLILRLERRHWQAGASAESRA